MKNYPLTLLVLFIVLSACNDKERSNYPIVLTAAYDTIIQLNSKQMLKSSSVVYGLNIKDTLDLSKTSIYNPENYSGNWKDLKSDSITVYVDASASDFHTSYILFSEFTPPPPPKITDSTYNSVSESYDYVYADFSYAAFRTKTKALKAIRERKHFATYLVFVQNNSKANTVVSGSILNGGLHTLLEAKDKNGDWKPIEYNYVPGYICGSGFENYLLKPNHSIVSTVKRYAGDYKTKIRVKLMSSDRVYYSNTFDGQINYSQFDKVEQVLAMEARLPETINGQPNAKRKLIFLDFD
ncbi:hypothetical protein [Olleya namhaensis]|uniref:hypothetical protein n=1 Tax=Olleya namhaensis TaxID=1144750 RepID=UPI00232E95A9|nr:hypothetical protein [Olleya namhaensis]